MKKSILILLAVSSLLSGCVAYSDEPGYHNDGAVRDRDGDGVRNRADRDRDGDGIRNRNDARPNNPTRY